ncbi:MAG: hypothetical protein ACT4OT_02590 [Acidobacteriota bacterium]
MYFKSYDSLIDSVRFSKEPLEAPRPEQEADDSSEYYYDDSTGYRIYKPENEDEDLEDEPEEEE